MYLSVYDLKSFYTTKLGRVVRRVLCERIDKLWPDMHGLRIMGLGYAVPYLPLFEESAERVFAVMPQGCGVHHWPSVQKKKNLTCLADERALPIETNSLDRVILIHHLEFCENIDACLQEVWRVLKSNGRLLVIVPNRSGLWVHADWSPFGHGRPYSSAQLCHVLREKRFVHERTEEALFVPPLKYSLFLKSAHFYERMGRTFLPIVAGVHMVEMSKQLYARPDVPSGLRERIKARAFETKSKAKPLPGGAGS